MIGTTKKLRPKSGRKLDLSIHGEDRLSSLCLRVMRAMVLRGVHRNRHRLLSRSLLSHSLLSRSLLSTFLSHRLRCHREQRPAKLRELRCQRLRRLRPTSLRLKRCRLVILRQLRRVRRRSSPSPKLFLPLPRSRRRCSLSLLLRRHQHSPPLNPQLPPMPLRLLSNRLNHLSLLDQRLLKSGPGPLQLSITPC